MEAWRDWSIFAACTLLFVHGIGFTAVPENYGEFIAEFINAYEAARNTVKE